jgi:hypothetical protein
MMLIGVFFYPNFYNISNRFVAIAENPPKTVEICTKAVKYRQAQQPSYKGASVDYLEDGGRFYLSTNSIRDSANSIGDILEVTMTYCQFDTRFPDIALLPLVLFFSFC